MPCKANITGKELLKMSKNLMSWGEAIKLNNRAFHIFFKRYPQMVLSCLLSVMWNALTPYVGIYFSALVIDELAGGRDIGRLRFLVLLTLVSAAVIALLSALLNKWKEVHNAGLWWKVNHLLFEKLLDMDYVSRDETKTAELLSIIRQNQGGTSWGLHRVTRDYEELCSSVFTLVGGCSLTVTLFVSRVPESA